MIDITPNNQSDSTASNSAPGTQNSSSTSNSVVGTNPPPNKTGHTNKFIWIIVALIVIVAIGIGYKKFLLPDSLKPVVTGKTRAITITAVKDEWRFEPEDIEAARGDKLMVTVINEDDYEHGIALDAFGVSRRMPSRSTIKFDVTLTQEGDYNFYCSVPCGEGEVHGDHRTHFDMISHLHVKSLVTPEK